MTQILKKEPAQGRGTGQSSVRLRIVIACTVTGNDTGMQAGIVLPDRFLVFDGENIIRGRQQPFQLRKLAEATCACCIQCRAACAGQTENCSRILRQDPAVHGMQVVHSKKIRQHG